MVIHNVLNVYWCHHVNDHAHCLTFHNQDLLLRVLILLTMRHDTGAVPVMSCY